MIHMSEFLRWRKPSPTAPSSNRTWQLQTRGASNFRAKDIRKGFWNLPLCQRKATEARCISEMSLHRGLDRPLPGTMKVIDGLSWKLKDVGGGRVMGYLPRKAADQVWISPRERTILQSAKVKGLGNLKSYLLSDGDAEFRVCHASCSYFGAVFPHCVPFPAFWDGDISSVPLHVGSMWYSFWFLFYGGLHLTDCHISQKSLWTRKQCWDGYKL